MLPQGSFGLFYVSYYVGVSVGVCLAYFVASFAPNMVRWGTVRWDEHRTGMVLYQQSCRR